RICVASSISRISFPREATEPPIHEHTPRAFQLLLVMVNLRLTLTLSTAAPRLGAEREGPTPIDMQCSPLSIRSGALSPALGSCRPISPATSNVSLASGWRTRALLRRSRCGVHLASYCGDYLVNGCELQT